MTEKDIAVRDRLHMTFMRLNLAPKSFAFLMGDHIGDSIRYLLSTPLGDINKGSVFLTMSKAIADEKK